MAWAPIRTDKGLKAGAGSYAKDEPSVPGLWGGGVQEEGS